MPQETNLNVSPYFDDFNVNKDYYKVLFKPGYPIQARELTTLQSILQNQIEQYGKHVFKEGSVVIPGQLKYENPLYAVEVEPLFNGAPISLYFDKLLGKKLRGADSDVSAEVVYILKDTESERGNYTLYLKYLQSGGEDLANRTFKNSETLLLETPLTYGNFTIQVGQGVCNTISENAISEGSGISIASGIYFVRGIFARVSTQTILLDQYSVTPSYRVGFNVIEEIINSDQDESLFDNAQGFSNYAAPGADRFKITLELSKLKIDDFDTDNFVEIMRVEKGVPQFFNKNPQYNLIRDELARRTFDESGNYFVSPFTLFVRDSLNDRVLNTGIFFKDQKTVQGNNPSEDLMIYEIGPGKAYVNGYDVETIAPKLLDVKKTRTTETTNNQVIPYNAGSLVVLNNCHGGPFIGLGTNTTVSLMDRRIGTSPTVASGTTIGVARVYDFIPESNYENDTSRLFLRLFDIQTYTTIGLTTSFASGLSTPCFIEGKKSKATGYLKDSVPAGSTTLTLYETTGDFLENEQIIINGVEDGRLIKTVTDYSISDIKSVHSKVGISTFNADLVLSRRSYIASPGTTFRVASNGNTAVVSAGLDNVFTNIIKPGDIVSYASTTFTGDPIYNIVTAVSTGGTSFTISGITTVAGICNGMLPNGTFQVNNIIKVAPSIDSNGSSLLTRLQESNVSFVNFEGNEILQRRSFDIPAFSGNTIKVEIDAEDVDLYFDSFDEDKFVIIYSDGSIEPMRSDKFDISLDGKKITFAGLGVTTGTNAKVIATVKNLKANSKIKKLNKASLIIISNSSSTSSGIGTTTLNDGLTFSRVYGTRVQDRQISLNVPDAVRVLAIYESDDISDPNLPYLQISGNAALNQNYEVGERIEGKTSGAVAIITAKLGTDKLEYVYLNTTQFEVGETVIGQDSTEESIISDKTLGDKNITQNFMFDDGQRDTFYDFSRITRKSGVEEPKRRLKIIFQNYTIDSSDTGELITANSYSADDFKHNVPLYQNSRLTDYIDIRPRVAPYTLSENSPFEFDSRKFDSDGQYSKYILAPGENLFLSYSYYVGRIDRVFLNSDGTFEISEGNPSKNPIPPELKSNSLDIATIYIPPYIYDVKNVSVDMSRHKRYRMSDIALLEDRLQRVEKYTTLSMLEMKTDKLAIKDAATGIDRFKCGFFVDNFSTHQYHDLQNPSFKSCIDTSSNTLRPLHYTTALDLQLGSEAISGVGQTYKPNIDQSYVTDLGSPNIRKTGDLITLDYKEVLYFEQVYATKSESITPFLVRYWQGIITLNPSLDTWIDERKVTTTSFKENTNIIERDDINETIVNNQTINQEVFVFNPPNPQTGVNPFDWIANARSLVAKTTLPNGNTTGNIGNAGTLTIKDNTISIAITKSLVRQSDLDLINRVLPADVAQQFITQINTDNGNRRVFLNFTQGQSTGTITEDRETTTTTTTTSNTNTIFVPPEITTEDVLSQSTSNYTEEVRYLRSRNIEFDIKGLRPRTRFYAFFQGIDVKNYVIPKLLEIEMISGKFKIGETVESDPHFTSQRIKFRICKPNHKTGPFDGSAPPLITNPVPIADFTTGEVLPQNPNLKPKPDIFRFNPYNQQVMPTDYSESSTFLNVDTRSLELPSEDYYGHIAPSMTLIGKESGAVARISNNIRLISDNSGRLLGSLFIPDPNVTGNPQWVNGKNTFTVLDTPNLQDLTRNYQEFISNTRVNESGAQEIFESSGTANITETNILTTRNITILTGYNINTNTVTNTTTNTTTVTQTQTNEQNNNVTIWEARDPLAQSFYVREDTGIYVTSVEVFFETKDEELPVTLQLRPLIAGVPSNVVIPFSEVTLNPDDINLSENGTVPTKFTFPSPVYLPGPKQVEIRNAPIGSQQTSEFAIVLLSSSPNYRVFISELGFNDIQTGVKISAQPTLGSLFKSQNGTTWSPAQLEDLKYRLYRADFVPQGLVRFYNPKLNIGNRKVTITGSNQFLPLAKRIIVGLGSTGYNTSGITTGVTIKQGNSSGKLIGFAGDIKTVSIANSGFGYTTGTFAGVELETETGYGTGAVATVGTANSTVTSITITSGGFGYQVGDSLVIPEKEFGLNVGFGARFTVTGISTINNSLIFDNVQGNFAAGIGTLSYVNSSNQTVSTGATIGVIKNDPYYDGLHMKISQMNHGMHSSENFVRISHVRPPANGVKSRTTVASLPISASTIPLLSTSGFETFEGLPVSPSNPGYVIIGNEVIEYTSISGNSLNISQRQVDGTDLLRAAIRVFNPSAGYYPVYKYEFNGISLRRINKIHNFAEVDTNLPNGTHPIELNSYFIRIDTSDKDFNEKTIGKDRSNDLYFTRTNQMGDPGSALSSNIQFEAITPNIAHIIPAKTNMNCRIRTFSGTSISGNEKSFADQGFETIPLTGTYYFDTPRLICSSINEDKFITESPGGRSFTMEFIMSTNDSRVSPVIDLIKVNTILTSNLINAPLGVNEESNYADEDFVRGLTGDKHSTIYISKPIQLVIPANALNVFLTASHTDTNDIRVLYRLFRNDAPLASSNYELFPGYKNYQVDGNNIKRVIDKSQNDGSADSKVTFSSDSSFRDYEYSADDLPDFNAFSIKIVMAGKNQAIPPLIKDLRAIATKKPRV